MTAERVITIGEAFDSVYEMRRKERNIAPLGQELFESDMIRNRWIGMSSRGGAKSTNMDTFVRTSLLVASTLSALLTQYFVPSFFSWPSEEPQPHSAASDLVRIARVTFSAKPIK